MEVGISFWIGFVAFVVIMLILDLFVFHKKDSVVKVKEALYNGKNIENVFSPFYNEKLKEYNSQFELILNVPLVENRIVIFDSSILHRSEGYGEKDHPRIIQTCFFRKIFGQIHYPIPEINRIK